MNQIATNQINKALIYIPSLVILAILGLYLFTDIINKNKDISNRNSISYTKLDKNKIADSNIYIYGYQGDILTSRGIWFLDMDSDNIVTVKHNINKSDNTYYIYDSVNGQQNPNKNAIFDLSITRNNDQSGNIYYQYDSKKDQRINIDDIYKSSGEDLSLIYSQEYINKNVTSIWINWNFYKITDNIANSWYIYLSWQAKPWQSWSPVYCDNMAEICGIIVASNEFKNQVKILLINKNIVNDIKK